MLKRRMLWELGSRKRQRSSSSGPPQNLYQELENELGVDESDNDTTINDPDGGDRDQVVPNQVQIQTCPCLYSFNRFGDGELFDMKITAFRWGDGQNQPPLQFHHKNILDLVAYDKENSTSIYRRQGIPFDQWVKEANEPIKVFDMEVRRGSTDMVQISYIPADFRVVVYGIIAGLLYIHELNFAVQDLNEQHICFVDGCPKLWRFQVCKRSTQSRAQNMQAAERLIRKIFESSPHQLPNDMISFLNSLVSTRDVATAKKLLNHFAIIPPRSRMTVVEEMFELKDEIVRGSGVGISGRVKPNGKQNLWWSAAAKDFFDKAKLNKWDVKFRDKMIGPVRAVYIWKGKVYMVEMKVKVGKLDVAADFFNFLRNLVHHLGQTKTKEGEVELTLSREEMDAVLFWAFGAQIIMFAECVDAAGGSFKMEHRYQYN